MKVEMTFAEWLEFQMPVDQVIIGASVQDGSDRFEKHVIGVSVICRRQYLAALAKRIEKRALNRKLYCKAFAIHTDRKRRGDLSDNPRDITRASINRTLEENGFEDTSAGKHYFPDLLESRFTFSPEGNGLDCHRHYEALVFKSIPIVEKNPLIEEKYRGLPVLYTTDYSEVDADFLDRQYERMLNEVFDFARLFMDFYDEETRFMIKSNGNFWAARLPELSGFDGTPLWPEVPIPGM